MKTRGLITISATALLAALCSSGIQTTSSDAIARQRGDPIVERYEGRVRETDVLMRTHKLAAPRADVLNALQGAYEKFGIEVGTLETARGLIGNTNFRASGKLGGRPMSDFIVCPPISSAPMLENTWFITMSVVTLVTDNGNGSTIQTAVQASAKDPHASSNPYRCESRSVLERLIAQETAVRLGVSLGS